MLYGLFWPLGSRKLAEVVHLGGGLQVLACDGGVADGGGVVDPEHGSEVQGSGPWVRASLSCRSARRRSRVAVRPRQVSVSQFSLTALVVMAVCWLRIRRGLAVPGHRRAGSRASGGVDYSIWLAYPGLGRLLA